VKANGLSNQKENQKLVRKRPGDGEASLQIGSSLRGRRRGGRGEGNVCQGEEKGLRAFLIEPVGDRLLHVKGRAADRKTKQK